MKHRGKARRAAMRIIWITLLVVVAILIASLAAQLLGALVLACCLPGLLWGVSPFSPSIFSDPKPRCRRDGLVWPHHGKVDLVDVFSEPRFLEGECKRISIFLSVLDVHVQNAPVTGRVALLKHTPGQFMSALRSDCGLHNENVLLGLEADDPAGETLGVRLIAGVLARRIVPWVKPGDAVQRGDRISLIQFGSRVEIYLPLRAKIRVQVGDRVVGGETVLAVFE